MLRVTECRPLKARRGEREDTPRLHLLFSVLQGAGIQSVQSCSLLSRKHLKVTWGDFPGDSGTKEEKSILDFTASQGKKPSPHTWKRRPRKLGHESGAALTKRATLKSRKAFRLPATESGAIHRLGCTTHNLRKRPRFSPASPTNTAAPS